MGEDVGISGGAASAEEAAMHIIDDWRLVRCCDRLVGVLQK